jgi:hypothetical protein
VVTHGTVREVPFSCTYLVAASPSERVLIPYQSKYLLFPGLPRSIVVSLPLALWVLYLASRPLLHCTSWVPKSGGIGPVGGTYLGGRQVAQPRKPVGARGKGGRELEGGRGGLGGEGVGSPEWAGSSAARRLGGPPFRETIRYRPSAALSQSLPCHGRRRAVVGPDC